MMVLAVLLVIGNCPLAWLLGPAHAEPPVDKPAAAAPAGSFLIPAWAFNRGNAKTFTTNWADAGPMVANGGVLPNVVEYDVPIPVPAT
jgi:hypothetical protein